MEIPTEIKGWPVLWSWIVPDTRKRIWEFEDLCRAYCIVNAPKVEGGIILYGLLTRVDEWVPNPNPRPVLAELLTALKIIY